MVEFLIILFWLVVVIVGFFVYAFIGIAIAFNFEPDADEMRGDSPLATAWMFAWPVFAPLRILWIREYWRVLRRPAVAHKDPRIG